jgi:hypothetical protein
MSICEGRALPLNLDEVISAIGADLYNSVSDKDLQRLLAVAVKSYSARRNEQPLAIFPSQCDITATDVMFAATAMLRAVNVHLFEFAAWQTFSGIRAADDEH